LFLPINFLIVHPVDYKCSLQMLLFGYFFELLRMKATVVA